MISLLIFLGFSGLAQCALDPLTGFYVPPATGNDVFYPLDGEEPELNPAETPGDHPAETPGDHPLGFPELVPPMQQEWRTNTEDVIVPFGGTTFKYKFVTRGGKISTRNPGNAIEVAATSLTSEVGHQKGAQIVALMLANIGDDVWNNMVRRRVRVGIFSRHEALSVYPEYKNLADSPRCRGSCSGSCKVTCTFDGRKWDTVAGAGGVRAAILESNILCDRYDPYGRGNNILAHEFIHTIHMNGLPSNKNSELNSAFSNAKRRRLWGMSSYAMQTVYEYFAEAGGVWFGVNHNGSSGGMDRCSGEMPCRSHLKNRDPKLYALLHYTFSPKNERQPGNLKICV